MASLQSSAQQHLAFVRASNFNHANVSPITSRCLLRVWHDKGGCILNMLGEVETNARQVLTEKIVLLLTKYNDNATCTV